MNKEKQIEEMAKIICNTCREKHISVSKNCKCRIGETCIAANVHSEALYDAGYRKEAQFIENMKNVLEIEKKSAVKEFARKGKDLINADYVNGCLNNHKGYLTEYDIDELLKEFLR